jgi:hypothetical protein
MAAFVQMWFEFHPKNGLAPRLPEENQILHKHIYRMIKPAIQTVPLTTTESKQVHKEIGIVAADRSQTYVGYMMV